MRWIGVDLIREERENPERGRERWCRGCAVWQAATGAEPDGERELGAAVGEVRGAVAERSAAGPVEAVWSPVADSPASTPIILGGDR